MADSPNEASKSIRFRSLRFMNQTQNSADYELPSLRAKPRQRQNNDNDSSDNDSKSDTGNDSESEHDELLDSEDSELEQESDDGSVFSMDEADDLDNEEELTSPTRSRDRQRRRRRQQNDTLATSSNVNSPGKRQRDNNDNRSEGTPPSNSSSTTRQHPPKRRKLRLNHTIPSATIYNDILSDDSEWMDQDFGIQYANDMDTVRNGRRRKSTTTSPLVLGSPSKVVKSPATSCDGGCKQQPTDEIHTSAVFLSPNRIQHSRQSSSSTATTTHGTSSPLSRLDEKKWPRRPQASAFLDKLQAKEEDTLDLSQHSFIPDDYLEHAVTTSVAATAAAGLKTTGGHSSHEVKAGQQTTISVTDEDDYSDAPMDSNAMAYQYDFSTISEPTSMAINPTSATMMDDHDDTHHNSTNPPTPSPTPAPNTTPDGPHPTQPGFFRRIISFIFG